MASEALAERIAHYLESPDPDGFDELGAALARQLHERDPRFRELCGRLGDGPPDDWRAIPPLPELHRPIHEGDGLARDAGERAFQAACLESPLPVPILTLIPGGDSEPTDAGARIAERFGGPGSASAVAGERIDVGAARSWLAGRQRDRRAGVALATRSSLERLLAALERQNLRFQLPPGSRLVTLDALGSTGGAGDLRPPAARSAEYLGLPLAGVLGRLKWRAIPTPLYGRLTASGGLEGAVPSPWVRIRAFDPETLRELPEGRRGRLGVLDLTLVGRPFHLLTATNGSVDNGTVQIEPD